VKVKVGILEGMQTHCKCYLLESMTYVTLNPSILELQNDGRTSYILHRMRTLLPFSTCTYEWTNKIDKSMRRVT